MSQLQGRSHRGFGEFGAGLSITAVTNRSRLQIPPGQILLFISG